MSRGIRRASVIRSNVSVVGDGMYGWVGRVPASAAHGDDVQTRGCGGKGGGVVWGGMRGRWGVVGAGGWRGGGIHR